MGYKEILYCMTNMVRIYTIYKCYHIFFDKFRFGKVWEMAAYILFWVSNSWIYLSLSIPLITMISNFFSLILISFMYQDAKYKKIVVPFITEALNVSAEMCAYTIFEYRILDYTGSNELLSGLTYIFLALIFYYMVNIISKFVDIKAGVKVPFLFWVQMLFLMVMSTVLLLTLYGGSISKQLVVLSTFCIFSVDIIAITLYDNVIDYMNEQVDLARITEQSNSYEKQLQFVSAYMEQTRSIRHDFKNHIGIVREMIVKGKSADAEQYLNRFIEDMSIAKNYASTGNTTLDAIINYKCTQAENAGIKINVNTWIERNLYKDLDAKDFMTILGNLMDNAIEAQHNLKGEKFIRIKITQNTKNLYINMENSYEHKLIRKKQQYMTTKEDQSTHGIGLSNVDKIVTKYHGNMELDGKDGVFIVNIMMILN